jgi:hypothetical protein
MAITHEIITEIDFIFQGLSHLMIAPARLTLMRMIQKSVLDSIDGVWSLDRALFPCFPFDATRFWVHIQPFEEDLQLWSPGQDFANIHLVEMCRLRAQ